MSKKAVIKSNLDKQTLKNVMDKGGFEAYPEREFEDGFNDYLSEENSIDFDVNVEEDNVNISDDEDDLRRVGGTEVAFTSKVTKRIKNEGEVVGNDEITVQEVTKIKEMAQKKKGFTVEDVIARNLDDLCCEHLEYVKGEDGNRKKTPKTWFKVFKNATMIGFSLSNALVGAGILSFGQSCWRMGVVGFVGWSILTMIFFVISWNYWNRAIYITGATTMGELLSLIFGKGFALVVDICNTGFYFCVMMCYQVIATQYIFGMICDLTDDSKFNYSIASCYEGKAAGIFCQWHYIILYIVAIVFNLTLIIPKSVKFLNRISSMTVVAACITVGVIVVKAIVAGAKGESSNNAGEANIPSFTDKWWPKSFMDFFTMAPFITANFQIHSSLPPLYVGTKKLSKKVKLVALQGGSYVSIVLCSALFVLMAVGANVSFDKVSSNVLNDFARSSGSPDYAIIVCKVLMTIVVILSYPALMFPTSAGIARYVPKSSKIYQIWNGKLLIVIIRVICWLATTVASTFVTDIGVIFSVASALFSIVVVYIGPMSIMMLWPRIEKLGKPDARKLSVVDNLLYDKVVDGNQYFTYGDVKEKVGDEVEIDANILKIITNECKQEIELEEEKEDIQKISTNEEDEIQTYEVETLEGKAPNCKNELMQYKNKIMKLPPAEIPMWRYILYGIAMGCCVILCILSIVGTIMDQFK